MDVTGPGGDVGSLLDPSAGPKELAATLADRYDAPIARIDGDGHDGRDDLLAKGFIVQEA